MSKKQPAQGQLSWLEEPADQLELDIPAFEAIHQENMPLTDVEIATLRERVLIWGKEHRYPGFSFPFNYKVYEDPTLKDRRFGRIGSTKSDWNTDTLASYAQREDYSGEWMVKLVEHLQRFDRQEMKIPLQSADMKFDENPCEDW